MLKLTVAALRGGVVPAGALVHGLTADQVRRRKDILAPVDGKPLTEIARASAPLFFKHGETVSLDEAALAGLAGDAWHDGTATLTQRRFAAKHAAQQRPPVAADSSVPSDPSKAGALAKPKK